MSYLKFHWNLPGGNELNSLSIMARSPKEATVLAGELSLGYRLCRCKLACVDLPYDPKADASVSHTETQPEILYASIC